MVLTLLPGSGYTVGDGDEHTLTIQDDDAPVASFAAASGEAGEGDGTHTVRVSLNGQASSAVTLSFSVSSPSGPIGASSPGDDSVSQMTATVLPGQSHVDIPVTIVQDGLNEADERLILRLAHNTYSVGSIREYQLTIVDDDGAESPVVTRDNPHTHGTGVRQFEVWEDQGSARPTWFVKVGSTEDVFTGDVIFEYVGGTATPNEDFKLIDTGGQTITVTQAGDTFTVRPVGTWARFIFEPKNDRKPEGDETAIFRVLNGPGYTVEETTGVIIIIRNAP